MDDNARFTIIYSGPALENNEIAIKELAPALLNVADLLEEVNKIVNGSNSKVVVNVRGSFKSGSFGIDFTVIQTAINNLIAFLSSDGITATVNLLYLIGFVRGSELSLIDLLKLIKKRPIKKIEELKDGRAKIIITQSETIEVDDRLIPMLKNHRVRKALEGAIAEPLEREGINKVITASGDEVLDKRQLEITKQEREIFKSPPLEDEILGEATTEAHLQIVSLSFREDNKWRFSRGETIFYASIEDKVFLDKVATNEEQFSKDDILKVKLRVREVLSDSGIRTEHTVLKVISHRSAARQLRLDDAN
jgi:hypothetical protein